MSEYSEKHSVARLVGAPPGYVGYEEGGQLTESVRRRPYSVVLLDEVEKAHPEVFDILLQVLDDGRLTDGQGRTVDFRNVVLILTSNLGSTYLVDPNLDTGTKRESVMSVVRQAFKPEFLNRLDEVVMFDALSEAELTHIVDLQVAALAKRLEVRRVSLAVTDDAKDWLARTGYDPAYGARPLRRLVQTAIGDQLARMLLGGQVLDGGTVTVDVAEGGDVADAGAGAEPAPAPGGRNWPSGALGVRDAMGRMAEQDRSSAPPPGDDGGDLRDHRVAGPDLQPRRHARPAAHPGDPGAGRGDAVAAALLGPRAWRWRRWSTLMRVLVYVAAALAAPIFVLAIYVLQRHRGARVVLTVAAALLLFTTPVAGLMPMLVGIGGGDAVVDAGAGLVRRSGADADRPSADPWRPARRAWAAATSPDRHPHRSAEDHDAGRRCPRRCRRPRRRWRPTLLPTSPGRGAAPRATPAAPAARPFAADALGAGRRRAPGPREEAAALPLADDPGRGRPAATRPTPRRVGHGPTAVDGDPGGGAHLAGQPRRPRRRCWPSWRFSPSTPTPSPGVRPTPPWAPAST